MLRPRAKTVSPRTMELLRRWGIADELRERRAMPVSWSNMSSSYDSVRSGSRSDLRTASGSNWQALISSLKRGNRWHSHMSSSYFVTRWRRQSWPIWSRVLESSGSRNTRTQLSLSSRMRGVLAQRLRQPTCLDATEGNTTRHAIGSTLQGGADSRPNLNVTFRAPELSDRIPHGPAIHYWVLNPDQPGIVGPLDLDGTWWGGGLGVDAETTTQTPEEIVQNLLGEKFELRSSPPTPGAPACCWPTGTPQSEFFLSVMRRIRIPRGVAMASTLASVTPSTSAGSLPQCSTVGLLSRYWRRTKKNVDL